MTYLREKSDHLEQGYQCLHIHISPSSSTQILLGKGRTRSNCGIKSVNIETEVKGAVAAGIDMLKRKFHDFANAVLVDVVHSENLDSVLLQNLLFGVINVSETYVDAK